MRKITYKSMLSKSSIWVESRNFYGGVNSRGLPFLVIGFDTDYKTSPKPIDREGLEAGLGRNSILSSQVHCKLYDPGACQRQHSAARVHRGYGSGTNTTFCK